MRVKGQCLCKAVQFSFETKEEKHFNTCHCEMCRKWGSSPPFMVDATGGITFQGEENITIYPSSDWAERGFCKICGSHLFYRLKKQEFYNFSLGALENRDDFTFATQIYTDAKPANYDFVNQTEMMTEQQVIEAFGFAE